MKKVSALRFFALYFSFAVTSNLVHPITPAFLQSINCPNYMFGVAFSAMALANFAASPFWGRMGDKLGYARIMGIGYLGYALGQLLLSMATNSYMVVLARMVGGMFSSGHQVGSLAYLVSMTDDDRTRTQHLSAFAALTSVGAAAGYFVGGMLGDHSLRLVFQVQIAAVVTAAALVMLTIEEAVKPKGAEAKIRFAEVNPVSSLWEDARGLSGPLAVFLFTVFLSHFANMAHDNAFNYYLRAQLDFPPSGNGIFKAVVGTIAIVANFTINTWLARRYDGRRSIGVVLGLCSLSLFAMVSVPGIPAFLATALLFYTFSVVFLPIQQVLAMRNGGESSKGKVSGLFNAARSLGMMAGPLFGGFAYGVNPRLPFVGAAVAFALAGVLCAYNARQFQRQEEAVS